MGGASPASKSSTNRLPDLVDLAGDVASVERSPRSEAEGDRARLDEEAEATEPRLGRSSPSADDEGEAERRNRDSRLGITVMRVLPNHDERGVKGKEVCFWPK